MIVVLAGCGDSSDVAGTGGSSSATGGPVGSDASASGADSSSAATAGGSTGSPELPPLLLTKHEGPVWEGTYVAGDPTVLRVDGVYRMYYTSIDEIDGEEHIMIAGAVSPDGLAWAKATDVPGESIALDRDEASWDRFLETAELAAAGDVLWMWYAGYPEEAETTGKAVANGEIGVATSMDGTTFTRASAAPVLIRGGAAALDYNALFSPTVVLHEGLWHMLYTGWAVDDAPLNPFIGLLGATSADGVNWTKHEGEVLSGPAIELAWAEVVKEADLVQAPDGEYYLFFTGDDVLGVAKATHPFGPWSVLPEPVLVADQDWEAGAVIAPSVLIEHDRVRVWYMGFQPEFTDFAVGYAEAPYPFAWQ